jgi:hypothetical protein
MTRLHDSIASSFLPRKQDVTEDYWEWLKWRLGQVGRAQCSRSRATPYIQSGASNTKGFESCHMDMELEAFAAG